MKRSILNFKTGIIALGMLFSTSIHAFTAVTSGNWTATATWGGPAPTLTVTNQNIIIPTGITVTLDADVHFSGLLSMFTVDGVLTNTTANSVFITQGVFGGSGTVSINKISFMSLAACTFSGNLNVKELHNSTTSLAFTAIANVSDTLNLDAGNLALNLNGNLNIMNNATIKINAGSINLNSGVFNSSNTYNVMYIGSSKMAGIELNTVTLQNLVVNLTSTAQVLTLNNNTAVNGNLNLAAGKINLNGRKLSLNGDLTMGAGSMFSSNATSDMLVAGSGTLTSALSFDASSTINDLTINRTASGMARLNTPLKLAGQLNLLNGELSIISGGSLTVNNASTVHVENGMLAINGGTFNGAAAYNVEYMGTTSAVAGVELTGSGLNNLTVDYGTNSNKVTIGNNTIIGGSLSMKKGMLDLNGRNLTLNGTMSQNSNASFVGNTASQLILNLSTVNNDTLFFDASGANSQTLNQLVVNTSGSSNVVLGSKLIIGSALTFVNGKIELENYDLVVLPAASIAGYSDTKYVATSTGTGALVMNVVLGSAYVMFPVGLKSNYSPASIQQNSAGISGNFSVRVVQAGITSIKVVNRNWMIESSATTIDANLKLAWVAAAEINGFDRTNAYVSHYMNSAWDVVASSSATVAANSTFELSRMGITSLSPFTVSQTGQAVGIVKNEISNEIVLFPNPSKYLVNIKMTNSLGDFRYALVDVTGRTILMTAENGRANTLDISALETGFYFIKATDLTTNTVSMKRFIKD